MSTSSITKQFVIKDEAALDRLMEIISEGEKTEETAYIEKACELVSDFESNHTETCYAGDDIRILTAFQDEVIKDIYNVILMTDHIYDVQFEEGCTILEIYGSCDFRRYKKEYN